MERSLGDSALCQSGGTTDGGGTCRTTAPPACAGRLVENTLALASGLTPDALSRDLRSLHAGDPTAHPRQEACQSEMVRAAGDYVSRRLDSLLGGRTPEEATADARPELDGIETVCGVPVVATGDGDGFPRVGFQCAAAIGAPGSTVDAPALRYCMETLLSTWVDRAQALAPATPPNVVFILVDDERWDALDAVHSVSGNPVMPLTLSELAASGVRFTNAYNTTPLCSPSRASILTGTHTYRHGVRTNSIPLGGAQAFNDTSTLATSLRNRGYRTGMYGKYLNGYFQLWGAGQPPYLPPGWSEWHAFKMENYYNYVLVENGVENAYGAAAADYSTDVLATKAADFIKSSVTQGKPFFLYFAPYGVHKPYTPAPRHLGTFTGVPPFRPISYSEQDVSDKPLWIQNIPVLTGPERTMIDTDRQNQLEALQSVDEAVGLLVQTLRNLNIEQNTMIIFTADNGFSWGEHRIEGKGHIYEENLRAPLIIRYPPLAPLPRTESRYALNIDYTPTIIALTGAVPPQVPDGVDLAPLIDGSATTWRVDFLTENWFNEEYPSMPAWAAVHNSEFKYAEFVSGENELYNYLIDADELASAPDDPTYAGLVPAMAARLRQLRPTWPGDIQCYDVDHDGYAPTGNPVCQTPIPDCDDANPQVWTTPGEVPLLVFLTDRQTLGWIAPYAPGTTSVAYDTLRSADPGDFTTAVCVESQDGTDTFATDTSSPAPGNAFFYLVRAVDACPSGVGPLGADGNGNVIIGTSCP